MRPSQPSFLSLKIAVAFLGASSLWQVFFSIYLRELGFSESRIGILLSVGTGFALFSNLVLGYLIDRFGRVKLVTASMLCLLAGALLTFLQARSFPAVVGTASVLRIAAAGTWVILSPLILFIIGGSTKAVDFSQVRMWGSAGYTLGHFVTGFVSARFGIPATFYLAAAVSLVSAILIFSTGRDAKPVHPKSRPKVSLFKLFKNRPFFLLILTVILSGIWAPGAFQFLPLYAKKMGVSVTTIGLLMTMPGITAFIGLPIVGKMLDRFGIYPVFLMGFILLSARTLCYALATSPVLLFAGQLLHLLTFPVMETGSVAFIHKYVPKHLHASAFSAFRNAGTLSSIWAAGLAGFWIEWNGYKSWYLFSAGFSLFPAALFGFLFRKSNTQ